MYQAMRRAYARLRMTPVLGGAASRLVWAAKGALGRPVLVSSPAPPRARRPAPAAPPDTRLLVALAAVQALSERVAMLETQLEPPRVAPPERPVARPGSVSVVVSTLDRAAWLDRALTALAYQRHRDVEVIVVAGPSVDETAEVLARHAPRIRVVECPLANLSASRNLGVQLAQGEVVAFLDDDAAPEPDWLERLCAPYADPAVGGVGGYIRDHGGVAFQCQVVTADRFARSAEQGGMQNARLDPPGPAVERYLSLTGANSAFRRQALLDVGGFDEAYAYFLDETDVCLRLVEAGWRLEVAPSAEVHHAYAPSAQRRVDRAPLSLVAPARSTAYFAVRNALERHGAAAVAEHLHAYAQDLTRDIGWRLEHGVVDEAHAERLLAEITDGLAQGVRSALGGPRRLLPDLPAGPLAPLSALPRTALCPSAERLRLCLLSQQYPTVEEAGAPPGGVAVWTQALAQALAARGHEVSVITRATGVQASVGFEASGGAGVWVHRVAPLAGAPRRTGLLAGLPASVAAPALAAAQEVARADPRRSFDAVMGPLWDLEPAALLGSPWPTVVSLHTACAQMTAFKPQWDASYRRAHVDRVIAGERRLLAAAPHVLANSAAAARDIGQALGLDDLAARATVIAHGLPDLARGVEADGPRTAGVEILFVGRLEPRKGIDVLLAAAPWLLAGAPDVRLVVVGEEVAPPGAASVRAGFMERHAGAPWLDRVRFEGPLPRAALLARYAACDLVVIPSRYESFGLTALEAMIFAKPCVASDAGGLAEVVAHGETGLLVAPGDPAALACALLRLVRSKGQRRRMGEAARRRYLARFTAGAMATDYEAWMRDIVARTRRLAAE